MKKPHIIGADIHKSLVELGLKKGSIVLVHSSLSKFGYVEGGADAVIDALIKTVGEEGTIAVPGFSFSLGKDGSVFDVKNTPSEMGKISEALRNRKGTYRSYHLTHSVAAIGCKAKKLTKTHSVTPCGSESPFRKLIDWGGYILLLGIDQNVNTTFHVIEEEKKLFYIKLKEIKNVFIINENGRRFPLPTKRHHPFSYDFNRMDKPLKEDGIMKIAAIGEAVARLIDAKGLYKLVCEYVNRDPSALLLKEGQERLIIPTSAKDLVKCFEF
ncbi:MAG: SPBc2 prophage-derived aminoglycoside N(3')-acetyltransferase-like protein YokD [Syntrophomonadaceae bacterium]|nr:SPBc2 prophage-derived aminoglycoside N(3')-acetyltransferase-like protein YokD [Bacillota bacterium]